REVSAQFFFSSRRRHTSGPRDWSSDVCSSDLGELQQLRVRPGPERTRVLQLFSPLPLWARRRWDAIAEPVQSSGCLFAYRIAERSEERRVGEESRSRWASKM